MPKQQLCQPAGREKGGGRQRGLQVGVEAARSGKESVPVQTEGGIWPKRLGSRGGNTGARAPTYAGVFSWREEDSGIMGGRQAWVQVPEPLLASASPFCSLSLIYPTCTMVTILTPKVVVRNKRG